MNAFTRTLLAIGISAVILGYYIQDTYVPTLHPPMEMTQSFKFGKKIAGFEVGDSQIVLVRAKINREEEAARACRDMASKAIEQGMITSSADIISLYEDIGFYDVVVTRH